MPRYLSGSPVDIREVTSHVSSDKTRYRPTRRDRSGIREEYDLQTEDNKALCNPFPGFCEPFTKRRKAGGVIRLFHSFHSLRLAPTVPHSTRATGSTRERRESREWHEWTEWRERRECNEWSRRSISSPHADSVCSLRPRGGGGAIKVVGATGATHENLYKKQFDEAKAAECQSWLDNEVSELVDTKKLGKIKISVAGRWVLYNSQKR